MEKITFTFEDTNETVDFFVLEQTKLNGATYLLVADNESDDAECLILKETESGNEQDNLYDIVEDDNELTAVTKVLTLHCKYPTKDSCDRFTTQELE